jgi:hypothetical protein
MYQYKGVEASAPGKIYFAMNKPLEEKALDI